MHYQDKKINILCFAGDDFNNSLDELKEHLNFNLVFSKNNQINNECANFDGILIHENILKNRVFLESLNKINIIKIVISKSANFSNFKYDEMINLPIVVNEFNKKIVEINTRKKFSLNSSILIKNYVLDKNEKKLKKDKYFIVVTEKEIQLLELLFNSKKPVKKKIILEKVWKYASDADTHTVETHIYRLRRKIIDKFKDDNFIINKKDGYIIWKKEIKLQ